MKQSPVLNQPEQLRQDKLRHFAAMVSVSVGFVMLAIKASAYLYTGSVAILSDAIESVVHIGATLAMYFSLRLSIQPPDEEHPSGHGRIEHFSVGFEGGMITLAGLGIVWATIDKFVNNNEPQHLEWGLLAMGAAACINLILGLWLKRVGAKTKTPILVADGKHVLSDVVTSAAVGLGVALVWISGEAWIDGVVALLAAAWISWEGIALIRSAFRGLMAQADPELLQQVIAVANEIRHADWLDIHSLRCQRSGDDVQVDFHLVVPGERTIYDMHQQLEILESAILERVGGRGSVLAHLDHPPRGLSDEQLRIAYPTIDSNFTIAAATRLTNDGAHTNLSQ